MGITAKAMHLPHRTMSLMQCGTTANGPTRVLFVCFAGVILKAPVNRGVTPADDARLERALVKPRRSAARSP
jgi:hypothetical protein